MGGEVIYGDRKGSKMRKKTKEKRSGGETTVGYGKSF
jgi:hypothetical protein